MIHLPLERSRTISFLLSLTLTLSWGCSYREEKEHNRNPVPDDRTDNPELTSYSLVLDQVLQTECVDCHSEGNPGNNNVDLSSYESITNCSNPVLVVPGNPEGSLLYSVVARGEMPLFRDPLTEHQIQLVRDWIAGGLLR